MTEAEHETARMVGVSHGLAHALSAMQQARDQAIYPPAIGEAHKRAAATLSEVKVLDVAIGLVAKQLRDVRRTQRREG